MPTYVSWEPGLSTFVEEVDNRQRELFSRLNDFFTAVVAGDGKEEIGEVMDFLVNYCVVHFGTEEFYMQESSYPRYSEHKKAHDKFTSDILDIRHQIEDGTNSYHVITLVDLLGRWVAEHVGTEDKEFGAHVKSVQPEILTSLARSALPGQREPSNGSRDGNGRTCKYVSDCAVMFDKFRDPDSRLYWRNRYCVSQLCEECTRKRTIDSGKLPADVPLSLLPNGEHLASLAR